MKTTSLTVLCLLTVLSISAVSAEHKPPFPTFSQESDALTYIMRAEVVRVIDGDTIVVSCHLPYNLVMTNVHVRLLGINAPELKSKDAAEKARAQRAKKFVEDLLTAGSLVRIATLESDETDSFGRTLAWVILPNGTNLSQLLLDNGLAEVYAE